MLSGKPARVMVRKAVRIRKPVLASPCQFPDILLREAGAGIGEDRMKEDWGRGKTEGEYMLVDQNQEEGVGLNQLT